MGASLAGAADMPVKAPPPAPAPVWSWTGFYVGANVGYGWSQKTFVNNFSPPIGAVDATPNPSGVVGGLQAGYNFQINSLLLGIEGNFDWSGAKSSVSCFPLLAPQTCTADPRWVAAITGRIGEIFGQSLFYVRGGAAWVHDSYSNLALAGAPSPALPGLLFVANETRAGWVIGGGIEYMFLPNWSAKIEYNYYGFPDKSVSFSDGSGDSFTELIKQNMQTVTVGINYHFGAVVGPAVAPAPYVTKAR
jgi:outer membrane immunogenic protein